MTANGFQVRLQSLDFAVMGAYMLVLEREDRALARESHAARRAGRRPATRLAEIDARAYYVFADGMVAPWHAARASA